MKNIVLTLLLLVCTTIVSAQVFYKTPSGEKYHLASCRMVKNVSQQITPEEAAKLGLGPCKICKPENTVVKTAMPNKAKGTSATVQCKGKTKAGLQCKHMTAIANGFCFQHQP